MEEEEEEENDDNTIGMRMLFEMVAEIGSWMVIMVTASSVVVAAEVVGSWNAGAILQALACRCLLLPGTITTPAITPTTIRIICLEGRMTTPPIIDPAPIESWIASVLILCCTKQGNS